MSTPVHKGLPNEVGRAFFLFGSGMSLLTKADKRKGPAPPKAVQRLWVRPSQEYREQRGVERANPVWGTTGSEELCKGKKEHTEKITHGLENRSTTRQKQSTYSGQSSLSTPQLSSTPAPDLGYSHRESLWEVLLKAIPQEGDVPDELTHKMKKKKKRKPSI